MNQLKGRTPIHPIQRNLYPRSVYAAVLLGSIVLVLLPWLVRLDGRPHADWEQFLGRFHPLAVHLPIGLILLVPLLEVIGSFRPALRETAGFLLVLAAGTCFGTLILGYLLAHGSGEVGAIVTRHMWGGIALTIGIFVCLLARRSWVSGAASSYIYPLLLTCEVLVLMWTAHQGGSLTHGSNYLTEFMPSPIKKMLVVGDAPSSGSFYVAHINLIFDKNCVSCHGSGKTEAGLRLDSYDHLMKGGHDGPVIVSGKPNESMLLARVTLPATDKHFMPAGRTPLSSQEISWIRAWIQQGASPVVANLAGISLVAEVKDPPPQPVGDYGALMPELQVMQHEQGAKLVPVSRKPSDGLVLNTMDAASSFGDAQLAQFGKFAPYIVEAELGRTAVTDSSFQTLSTFTHLRALHLEGTAVTGNGLSKLTALSQLTYLNLSDTKVTASALAPLAAMKQLRHVYTFNTPAQQQPM